MTINTQNVVADVAVERDKQDAKWGRQDHPDLPTKTRGLRALVALCLPTADYAKHLCDVDKTNGDTNWARIAVEELVEAVEEADKQDLVALRKELVQCAAVFVAWIEALDRRTKPAPIILPYEVDKDAQ